MPAILIRIDQIRHRLKSHRPFLILLLFFAITTALTQSTLPAMEGVDETLHFNYVVRVRSDGVLPDRSTNHSNGTRQESGQPPLTYWVMATFMNLVQAPTDRQDPLFELDRIRNLWYTPVDPWRRTDNENVYYEDAAGSLIAFPQVTTADRIARLVSLFFGIVAVIGAYGAMRQVFDHPQWVLLSTALFAFMPVIFQISAVVSNDGGAVAFATLVIWQTLRLLKTKDGAAPGRLLFIGVLLGFTGLSKLNALLIGTGVVTALLLDWRVHHLRIRRLVINGLLVAVPFILLFGPWILYGWLNYHSAFGLEGHTGLFADPNQGIPSPGAFLTALSEFALTYLGKLGAGGIRFNPLLYGLLIVIMIGSLLGYGLWLLSHPKIDWHSVRTQQTIMLLVITITMVVGIVYWLVQLFAINEDIQGRLIYPGHAVFVIFVMGGLYFLHQRLPQALRMPLRLYVLTLPIALSLIVIPIIQLVSYAPPKLLTPVQTPVLQGRSFDFDHTIRFLGYQPHDTTIRANTINTFTLCWQVLRVPTHDAAFSLKLFDDKGIAYGDRTSVMGMGHYAAALWQVGAIFCDDVDMQVKFNLPTKQTFNLLVVLLDPHTMATDWPATTADSATPIQYPIVDRVTS